MSLHSRCLKNILYGRYKQHRRYCILESNSKIITMVTPSKLACVIVLLSAISLASAESRRELRQRRKERQLLRHQERQLREQERIWGAHRNLATDPCIHNTGTCFDISGCMLCKAYTSESNGDIAGGHIQCLKVEGNTDLYEGINFEGCCATEEGGSNLQGEVCRFWENET